MSLRPSERMDARKVGYKSSLDKEEARRKREQNIVEIRKNKREEGLLKKRREGMPVLESLSHNNLEIISSLAAAVMSGDAAAQLNATIEIRKLLSMPGKTPVDEIVNSGVVPYLVNFLRKEDATQLQIEVAWALTNIAAGTSKHASVLVDYGVVPLFVQILYSPCDELREQAVWGLGNFAGDSVQYRDLVLSQGAMQHLLAQFNEHATTSMMRNATWTLSNLFRGRPRRPSGEAKPVLPILARILQNGDEEITADACWCLSYICDGNDDDIQNVIDAGVCQKLVELLMHPSLDVVFPSLRTIGNIVTGSHIQTQYVVDHGALPCLLQLITNDYKRNIRKEACWTISNITAGSMDQIQAVIEKNIIPPLMWILTNSEFNIKKEAAWAITNAASGGSNEQIKYLVSQGCVKHICDLLICQDTDVVAACLEALENILRVAHDEGLVDKYATLIGDADGLDKIEALQQHENSDIYEKALDILEKYLAVDEDEVESCGGPDTNNLSFTSNQSSIPPGGFSFT